MTSLPADWLGLTALVFLLGLRHGFDPDHLAAIDGLVRSNARVPPRMSRWAGLFFSLGHGAVVTLIGLAVAVAATDWQAPHWLEGVGAGISIGVLLVLGVANLLTLVRTPSDQAISLVGVRSHSLAGRLAQASHPVVIASIGAAFALSFDTISHAVLFSLTGATMAGWVFAALLGIVFTLGMVVTDTLNGWWVAHLIQGADRRAAIVSRAMSVAIALLCLALAGGGFARYLLPVVAPYAADFAPAVSVAMIAVLLATYAVADRLARAPRRATPSA